MTEQNSQESSGSGTESLNRAIAECAEQFAKSRDQYTILKKAVTIIREDMNLDRAGIFLYDEKQNQWEGVFGTDVDGTLRDERWIEIPTDPNHPFLRAAAGRGDEFFVEEFESEFPDDTFMFGVKNFFFIALRAHDRLMGGISVDNLLSGRPITKDMQENLRRFARYVSLALENLHLLERTEKQNRQLTDELEMRMRAERERETLMVKLQRANEDLMDFAHVVAHDIRSPLHTINGMIEWLKEDFSESLGEDAMEKLEIVSKRTGQIRDLVNGILEYSRLGEMGIEQVQVCTSKLVIEVAELLNPPSSIHIHIADDLPDVMYDRTQLHQVFQNLIGNAIKYMGGLEGDISISCRKDDGYWVFSVQDTGQGIADKDHERIFKMLQKANNTRGNKSCGIGLAVVKKIVERNGGQIWVDSTPGKGSTFHFTAPENKTNGK